MCVHYPGATKMAAQGMIEWSELKIQPDLDRLFELAEYYPLREVPAMRIGDQGEWILEERRWGLLPKSWKPSGKSTTAKAFQRGKINARSETIHTTWPWKHAFRQRCVLLAGGFCEPHPDGGESLYTLPNDEPFFIAGLWDRYEGDDGQGKNIVVDTCVMLTCDANALVASTRKGRLRQPVMIKEPDAVERYCKPEMEHEELRALFEPWPADRMVCNREPPRSLF